LAEPIDSKLEFRQAGGAGITGRVSSASVDNRNASVVYKDKASLTGLAGVADGLDTSISR
jgi:hypothetical protein